ncbi:LRR receptor-like serine/threonine-protein kinase [Olea europaea var. sylvestris]|uniref:LRR receptor-like serine/threonine-protein kinase n=1 Tax=Olea europaea var. sylvestris TaxID=158386 RepID=UPI000C1D163A|nr:LRR receptor-like serine/threonine-protein kinase [Olea europaea var. sylvestris]
MEKSQDYAAAILLIVTLMVCLAISETNVTTDQASLLTLKAHISLDPSGILLKNWSSFASVCEWIGVTCSSRNQRVAALDISGNSLSGNLPVDICHGLPRLTGLYLSSDELDGNIPSDLSECSQLQLLSLSHNKFSGSIPREIGRIRTLQTLYLGSNVFSGI